MELQGLDPRRESLLPHQFIWNHRVSVKSPLWARTWERGRRRWRKEWRRCGTSWRWWALCRSTTWPPWPCCPGWWRRSATCSPQNETRLPGRRATTWQPGGRTRPPPVWLYSCACRLRPCGACPFWKRPTSGTRWPTGRCFSVAPTRWPSSFATAGSPAASAAWSKTRHTAAAMSSAVRTAPRWVCACACVKNVVEQHELFTRTGEQACPQKTCSGPRQRWVVVLFL